MHEMHEMKSVSSTTEIVSWFAYRILEVGKSEYS